jgi:hypothetical protein
MILIKVEKIMVAFEVMAERYFGYDELYCNGSTCV